MSRFVITLVAGFVGSLAAVEGASAATFDFSGVVPGPQAGGVVTPQAVFDGLGSTLVFGPGAVGGEAGGFCGEFDAAVGCDGLVQIDFAVPVTGVTFRLLGVEPGDIVQTVIDGADGPIFGSGDALADLSGFGAIDVLVLQSFTVPGQDGVAFADFAFDDGTVPAVPLPGALALLVAGLGGLAAIRGRR